MSDPDKGLSQISISEIAMEDLDVVGKEATVTVTSIDAPSERPILGRRKTTNDSRVGEDGRQLEYEHEQDGLTKFERLVKKIYTASLLTRYALYILPFALVLAIPIILMVTVYKNDNDLNDGHGPLSDNIHLLGLFIWLEEIWILLWVCKLIAHIAPVIFEAFMGVVSAGLRKYARVLVALEIPISLLLWTCGSYGATQTLTVFDRRRICENDQWLHSDPPLTSNPCQGWPHTLQRIFLASIVVSAVFLAQKTVVQLIAINYHRTQYDHRIQNSKKLVRMLDVLYERSRKLFPEFSYGFEGEDEAIQGSNTEQLRRTITKAGVHHKVLNDLGRVRDKVTAAFGEMVTDISGKKVFESTSVHSIVSLALNHEHGSKALARRLWVSFAADGKDALYKDDLIEALGNLPVEQAEEIFHDLDVDDNGDVSLEEMILVVLQIGQDRKNIANSIHDVSEAIAVLDRMLGFIALVATGFVYAAFFSLSFETKITSLWTTFTGLSFAIGGTVTEFLACCIFLFIKHPYDVGDRVEISGVELVVEHISLMFTVFRRIDSHAKTQIPHNIANSLWVQNVTRSKAMTERITLSVASSTSDEDILALQHELRKFVTAEEHRRDFKPDFDIELLSVGNLAQLDLCVEIKHKSNWTNEHVRRRRRTKFMAELLAACRRVPILGAGKGGPGLGDIANPTYSVAISSDEAEAAKTKQKEKVDGARLFPVGEGETYMKDAVSTALERPFEASRNNSVFGKRPSVCPAPQAVRTSFFPQS